MHISQKPEIRSSEHFISYFFFSSRRRHTRYWRDWSSDVCSSDLQESKKECPGIAVTSSEAVGTTTFCRETAEATASMAGAVTTNRKRVVVGERGDSGGRPII